MRHIEPRCASITGNVHMSDKDLLIRPLKRCELDAVFEWSAQEGWNPGLHDGDCFYAAYPEAFLGGFLDGELIGSVSAAACDDHYGFIGLYIVRPKFRGRGYGMRLFQHALDLLGARVVGLDGVVERQSDYARSGFRAVYRNVRFRGIVPAERIASGEAVPVGEIPFEQLMNYDQNLFPSARRTFLENWFDQPGTVGLGLPKHGQLAGYGVIRRAKEGYRIGPLFADSAKNAEQLFQALCGSVDAGATVFLDVPESNPAAVELAERQGMERVFETARMYRGAAPVLPLGRIFGVTTLELG